jgi:hypothetical protein
LVACQCGLDARACTEQSAIACAYRDLKALGHLLDRLTGDARGHHRTEVGIQVVHEARYFVADQPLLGIGTGIGIGCIVLDLDRGVLLGCLSLLVVVSCVIDGDVNEPCAWIAG